MPIVAATSAIGVEDSRKCSELIDDLALYVGAQNVAEVRTQARHALRSAVQRYNRVRAWVDRLLQVDITFVADARRYALPSRFRKPLGRGWLRDASGNRRISVRYKPFEKFLVIVDTEVGSGQPNIFTIQNKIDNGQVEVWPVPNSSTIINFPTMRFFYYAEIPVCNDDDGSLAVGAPIEDAILEDARWRLVQRVGDIEHVPMLKMNAMEARFEAEAYDNEKRIDDSIFLEFE